MLQATAPALPQTRFARAKKARRAQKATEQETAAAPTTQTAQAAEARPERLPPLTKLLLACGAVLALFAGVRLSAPLAWSYDEFYHLGLAREMLSGIRLTSFHWTPFSILYDHYADATPLFHLLLMPFARLPFGTASFLGVLLGQTFLLGAFGFALWSLRVPRPWWFVLALPALGSLFAQRMEMCRPQIWLIGFSVLVLALLVERRWKTMFVVCALFGLTHTGGWIAFPMAVLWSVSGWATPRNPRNPRDPRDSRDPDRRRVPWQPVAMAAGGWLLGQLVHPDIPENFRLFFMSNFVIPFQATAAGDAALRSQLGTELAPPGMDLVVEQWPALIAPVLVAFSLLTQPRVRTRATLTTGLTALAFVIAGSLFIRRFFELGAPLAILALALVLRERRAAGIPPLWPKWGRAAAAVAIAAGLLWGFEAFRFYNFGHESPPDLMAAWMSEHGAKGERVFTAQWADSAPLFYFAPQLQTLVALDPTAFYMKDPRLFETYVTIVQGRHPNPADAIRRQFGARWVTLWKMPAYKALGFQLMGTPGARIAWNDRAYMVVDLGKPGA